MRGRRRFVWLLVVLLVTSACGIGSDDEPDTSSPTATVPGTATTSGGINPLVPQPPPTYAFISDADLASTATVSGCPITPYTRVEMSDGTTDQLHYEANGIRIYMDFDDEGRWYAGEMGFHWELEPPLTGEPDISATSRESGTQITGDSLNANGEHYASIVFPGTGCWDVSVVVGDRELAFTVWVSSEMERPRLRAQLEARAALRPWDPPADCAVTELGEPFLSMNASTFGQIFYTVEGSGMRLVGDFDLLFEGENQLRWYPDTWIAPVVEARLPSQEAALFTSYLRTVDYLGEHALTTVLFPVPGCWHLSGTAGDQTVEATVYVYPAACRPPSLLATAVAGACERP